MTDHPGDIAFAQLPDADRAAITAAWAHRDIDPADTFDQMTDDQRWETLTTLELTLNGSGPTYAQEVDRITAKVDPETDAAFARLTADDADWPVLDPAALYGPIGRFVTESAPHTEADPAAILVSTLTALGTLVGNGPYVLAGNAHHPPCLFSVVVGDTAKARKGTSLSPTMELANALETEFAHSRVLGGFGSAEKLIDELAPAEGDRDPRLLVVETEFGRVLRVAAREGSTLSQTIRDAWDGRRLAARSRAKTSVADDHHVGFIGHITAEELRLLMTEADVYGGLANRFLWACARKTQDLPRGGSVPAQVVNHAATELIGPLVAAQQLRQQIQRTGKAEDRWADLYHQMSEDDPAGLMGAVICRDAPQVLRLSLVYALFDGADAIDVDHVEAAWALWGYCRASADRVFGDLSGDRTADRLLEAIRLAGDAGLDATGQHAALGRHLSKTRLDETRRQLEDRGLIVTVTQRTGGRPRVISFAN